MSTNKVILSFFLVFFCVVTTKADFENTPSLTSQNISFITNEGQIADLEGNSQDNIKFQAHIGGANLYFKSQSIEYNFYRFEALSESELTPEQLHELSIGNKASVMDKMYLFRVDMEFLNSNENVDIFGKHKTGVKRNYYLAHCPDGILNVDEFSEIYYKGIYDNIDLRFYSDNGHLKYDFIVHPGGCPTDIKLKYNGNDSIMKTKDGLLKVFTEMGILYENVPFTYQGSSKRTIDSRFTISDNIISFDIDKYDTNKKLVIDPEIHWATYYNNDHSSDTWTRPVFSSDGSMINAGYTYSSTYTIINPGSGAYIDPNIDGSVDLVIVKFNSNHELVWATYYGGNNSDFLAGHTDYGKAIAIDGNDNIFIAGHVWTGVTNTFPTYNPGGGAFYQDQSKIHGTTSFFLKFSNLGVREWATMFQHENANTNSSGMRINGIVATSDKLYFTGETYRSNNNDIPLRTLSGAYNNSTFVGQQDAFVGRFTSNGVLEWCTYLNSGNTSQTAYAQGVDLAVDNNNNLFFVGRESNSSDNQQHLLIDPGGSAYFQPINAGDQDLTITKFNSSRVAVWSTYYGGNAQDIPSMIETDIFGNVFIVCRSVRSTNWPCYDPGGGAYYQNTKAALGTANDAGILKFSNSGERLWATYYGGGGTYQSGVNTYNATTALTGIGVDSAGTVYISGFTQSPVFPTQNKSGSFFSGTKSGPSDAVFLQFDNNGVRQWATYYGGTGNESLYSGKGAVYESGCETALVAFGTTNSTNFPTVNPGGGALYQSSSTTTNANVIYYFTETTGSVSVAPNTASATPASICPGQSVTLSITGGTLGTGATWEWYSDSCGGTPVGSGSSITVNPTGTTTYYVRGEGPCNITSCVSVTVTTDTISTAPTSLTASPSAICAGDPVTITVDGGSLGTGAQWELYEDSCGGTFIASNTSGSFTVSPTSTTTYYVLADGNCNTTPCESVMITVEENSVAPNTLIANPSVICANDTVTFGVVGGTLGFGASWYLYADSCGGTAIAQNTTGIFNIVPTSTTYYVQALGTCDTTACVMAQITLSSYPDSAGPISGPVDVCQGAQNISYTIPTVSNASHYLWDTPVGFTGSSSSNTININIDSNATSGTITVYAINDCGYGPAAVLEVTVHPTPQVSFSNTLPDICANDNPVVLTGGTPVGGSYSGNHVSNNEFNPHSAGQGIHEIFYTYVDTNGCTNSAVNTIEVLPLPQVTLSPLSVLCENDSPVSLSGGLPSGGYYDGSYVNNNLFDPMLSGAGLFTVFYIYTDSITGCSDTAQATITVEPQVTLHSDLADNTVFIDIGTTVNFTALPAHMGIYQFYINEQLEQESTSHVFTTNSILSPSTVTVVLNEACSDSLKINVRDLVNAFTPFDADGINEIFMPGVDLTIINRWGQELYRGTEGWDGTYNNNRVSPGTYFYIITVKDIDGKKNYLHGSVTLVSQ